MISHPKNRPVIQPPLEIPAIRPQFERPDQGSTSVYVRNAHFQPTPEGHIGHIGSSTTERSFLNHLKVVRPLGNSFLLRREEPHAAYGHSEHPRIFESRLAKPKCRLGYQVLLSCRQYNIDFLKIKRQIFMTLCIEAVFYMKLSLLCYQNI